MGIVSSRIPNVELSSVLTFLSGFSFDILIGALVGLTTMFIYTFWNPWGCFLSPIGLAMIGCTTFIGIIGGIAGRNLRHVNPSARSWFWEPAVLGLSTTFFYGLATNYAYSLTFGLPFLITLVAGSPFMLVHMVSNSLLFWSAYPSSSQRHTAHSGIEPQLAKV